jgi:23S rRNA pseudouridine1911/1915/1917 synthase
MTRIRGVSDGYAPPPGVDEQAVVTVLRVPPEHAGQRVDVFVQAHLHRTSRTRAQAIMHANAYDGDGRKLAVNDRVRPAQEVLLWRAPWDETPVPTDVPVLYEDEHLMAVDKPALLPVHPTARYHRNTLIRVLAANRPDCGYLSLGHRLDRETSGVMLVSKTRACDRALKRRLEDRDGIDKTYTAITWGVPADARVGAPFRCERAIELDLDNALRVKMRLSDRPGALRAATTLEVTATKRVGEDRVYALVRCVLETGRQHQIRLHLASLGAPVVGDKLYGPDERLFARGADGELTPADLALLEMPRHALHSSHLALPHPITGAPLAIEAPLPRDMADFWARA